MKKIFLYPVTVAVICICVVAYAYICIGSSRTTVILVRHAEKLSVPGTNPPLSSAGHQRAETLAFVLNEAGIDGIFISEFQRTQQTAAPTADEFGLSPILLPAADKDDLVDQILSDFRGQEVLVAGHSNTVPEIIELLGIDSPPVIPDHEYDNFFVVHIYRCLFRKAKLLHLKYGNPSE